jgi:hypothetical protein
MTTTTHPSITEYLKPVIEAARLLQLRPYDGHVKQVTAVLHKLNPRFPRDTMAPVDALRAITNGTGSVEELDMLMRVWPDWSGDVSYTLTDTTLTRRWSSKHSGVYTRITVPFPTLLPMTLTVERYCDMDQAVNHSDVCPVYHSDTEEEASDDCDCEGGIEQTVQATVTEWNATVETQLREWLSQAVIGHVEPMTFPAPVTQKRRAVAKRTSKR